MNVIKFDPATILPKDPFLEVLSYLHPIELAQCMRVNKKWYQFAGHERLWKPLLIACEENNINLANTKVWKLIVRKSDFELLPDCMINLCKRIKINETLVFKCLSLKKAEAIINLQLACFDKDHFSKLEVTKIETKFCILIEGHQIGSTQYLDWVKTESYRKWKGVYWNKEVAEKKEGMQFAHKSSLWVAKSEKAFGKCWLRTGERKNVKGGESIAENWLKAKFKTDDIFEKIQAAAKNRINELCPI